LKQSLLKLSEMDLEFTLEFDEIGSALVDVRAFGLQDFI
jgi:hypothetical protein